MTQYLPPNLLALFAPRESLPFLPPVQKLPHEKKNRQYTGVGDLINLFEDPKDTPPPTRAETKLERLERRRREKAEQVAYKLEQEIAMWDPHSNTVATMDPFKTLYIARINYDTSESKLRREFEVYGPIRKITVIHDKTTGKPRGYAFIEYEHERDMHSAYKHADGKKIDGRRVLVDVERARTVKGWLPRRLGGGLGGTRRGGPDVNIKHSGREDNERERERYERERGRGEKEERVERTDRPERPERVERGDRRRSRSRDRGERRKRSRSRSRDRDRKRHRSRSLEITDERKRDRGDRDKDRERRREKESRRRRSRTRSKERGDRGERKRERRERRRDDEPENKEDIVRIKEEPQEEGYEEGGYQEGGYQEGYEEGEYNNQYDAANVKDEQEGDSYAQYSGDQAQPPLPQNGGEEEEGAYY